MFNKLFVICLFMFSTSAFSQKNTDKLKTYLNNDELDKAEAEFKLVFKNDTTSLDYLLLFARLSWKKGNYLTASKYYLRSMPLDSAKANNGMAILYAINKEYQTSLSYINTAIRLNPNNADYLNTRGNIYYSTSQYDSALVDYEKALKIDSLDDHISYNIGLTLTSLSKYNEAIRYYTNAIKLRPTSFKAYFERGLANMYSNNYNASVMDLKESLKYKTKINYYEYVSEGSIYHYISDNYYYMGKKSKFKKYARKALKKGWTGKREDLVN